MSVDDRKKLTAEEAFELVKKYVKVLWSTYSVALARNDPEDAVMDIMLKVVSIKQNPDYNPSWEPGEVASLKKTRGDNGRRVDVDTSYMLNDNYNADDPYDPISYLMKSPTFNYLDKYNGRTTSKAYYIMTIVKNSLKDMVTKRDPMRYADSLDRPIDDSGDSKVTLGDVVSDPNEDDMSVVEQKELRRIILKLINMLPNESIADKESSKGNRGAVGWSPLTGQVASDGSHIENLFTLRDAAMHKFYEYKADEVASFYHRADGSPISPSSVSAKYSEVMKRLPELIQSLPDSDKAFLRSLGYSVD